MVEMIGLLVAILAIFLSFYWWNTNQQKKLSAKTTKTTSSKGRESSGKEEEDSKRQQQKKNTNDNNAEKKKPTKKNKPSSSSSKSKSKYSKNSKISSDPHFLKRYGGHAGAITAYSVSPDGRWLATAGADGKIRVTKADDAGFQLSCTVKTPGSGVFQDHLSAISWLPTSTTSGDNGIVSNPTVVGTIDGSRQMAFFRIRRKKSTDAKSTATAGSGQYELIELVKRRFDISSKVEANVRIAHCIADQSHSKNGECLVFTKTEYDPKHPQQKHPNTIAWNGSDNNNNNNNNRAVSTLNTNAPGIRISPDGAFLSGRGGIMAPEAKIFELRRKKVKGASEPVFDSLSSRSVMTLVPETTGSKVADVVFCGGLDNSAPLGILACDDGTVEVWGLDVDFRQKEDPKFLCSTRLVFEGDDDDDDDDEKKIVCIAASVAVAAADSGGTFYRIAVATDDSALHLLSYRMQNAKLSVDFSIDKSHRDEGVGGLQFCPSSGNVLYSTGKNNSRDVYSWKLD